ncbi:hypothetical protein MesoLjLc_54580 [Mesorhizobium sp. L-8-10]|uniref:DUF2259 domain-containing protein n=1 Tax=Mesorhizobium sp. L-8-10 TaxID=2744523 RepID=UPI0019266888|nr:DUF2259 domain-containing protein [Mesorhizobium sp. L-8-10]BCH33528.1 hypothetical protein MesoLjLc_54580 [Mesorhizobium sp. L-8-10]
MRPAALATSLFALALIAADAFAGDTASLEILGFSQDGAVFAFEEYGVQDGSGFPYSNRYYIDTRTDRFLPETPVRVRLDDEAATLDAARTEARERGEKFVTQSELSANRGFTAGANAVTELSTDPFRLAVNPRPVFPAIDPMLEFRLDEIPIPVPEPCASQGEARGFRLIRIGTADGEQSRLVHEDKSIPRSRGCPNGYRLGAIQTFSGDGSLASYAVLISVRQYGFEGPDHRWIAVTGRF